MRSGRFLMTSLAVAGLLIPSSLAIYYRSQALYFEKALADAVALPDLADGGGAPQAPAAAPREAWIPPPETRRAGVGEPAEEAPAEAEVEAVQQVEITPKMQEEMEQRRKDAELRRQYSRQQALDSMRRATNYFANRKTSGMTAAQQEEFNRMAAILKETVALKELSYAENQSRDRGRAGATIKSNLVVLASMLERERRQEYVDLAMAMGHSAEDAAAFAGYIDQIISNTSIGVIFPDAKRGVLRGSREEPRGSAPRANP
ncbi:MAG: hypothetical protein WCI17_07240 [bacterium]